MSPPGQRPPAPRPLRPGRIFLGPAVAACVALFLAADPVAAADTIPQVIGNLRNWLVGLLAGLATLFLTVGGLRYLMAGGDPGEVESAKRALRAAATGYGLAVLAPVIVEVLKSLVGAP